MKKITSVLLLLSLLLALMIPVSVAAENPVTEEGLYYEIANEQVTITDCVESTIGEVVIPAEIEGYPVTAIRATAFFGCHSLSSVVIPDTVTSIGDQAFQGSTNLSKVVIPASVVSIGFDAFHNTAYYNNDNNWDNYLLYIDGCLVAANIKNLAGSVVINEGTRLIAGDVFFGSKITAVSIPASVTVVGARAFTECANLTDVYYGGKEADWKAMAVADGNTAIEKAKKHYEKLLDKPDPQAAPNQDLTKNPGDGTTPPPATDKKRDLWLWVSIISGAVAVVTFVLMFLPKKKEQEPAADEEMPDEQPDEAKPVQKKKK